jgi:hypothetical protein
VKAKNKILHTLIYSVKMLGERMNRNYMIGYTD